MVQAANQTKKGKLSRQKEKEKIAQAAKQTKQQNIEGRKKNRGLHRQPSRQSRESIVGRKRNRRLHRHPSRQSIVGRKRNRDCTGSQSDRQGRVFKNDVLAKQIGRSGRNIDNTSKEAAGLAEGAGQQNKKAKNSCRACK